MLTERQKFKQMDEYLKGAHQQNDTRKIVLTLGLYAEYAINELLKIKLGYQLDKLNSEELKLRILRATNNIAESEYIVLETLRKIRNEYAHKLEIDEAKIKELMLNSPLNWASKDEKQIQLASDLINRNPLLRFYLSCLSKMQYLFSELAKLKGEKFT